MSCVAKALAFEEGACEVPSSDIISLAVSPLLNLFGKSFAEESTKAFPASALCCTNLGDNFE